MPPDTVTTTHASAAVQTTKRARRASRPGAPWPLRVAVWLVLAFMHLPLLMVAVYAFNVEESAPTFPPPGWTLKWFARAVEREDIWRAIGLSLQVALFASALAMLLGTLAALAVNGQRFHGRDGLTTLFNLPIALPGIITGIALLSSIRLMGWEPSVLTIVVGHTTFCVVMVYQNVLARLRRLPGNLVEASMDLGADDLRSFWHITLPGLASAMLAGGMLAFALSFDEIIVTTFTAGSQQTLPIWLLNQLSRPREMPITNVVALIVTLLTTVPILLAYKLSTPPQETSQP